MARVCDDRKMFIISGSASLRLQDANAPNMTGEFELSLRRRGEQGGLRLANVEGATHASQLPIRSFQMQEGVPISSGLARIVIYRA
jgi:hypothetical protein